MPHIPITRVGLKRFVELQKRTSLSLGLWDGALFIFAMASA
jgi:hypothetical protein